MKLTLSEETKYQNSVAGTYFLQEYMTNNKQIWIHQSGAKAIWWDKDFNNWIIGNFENLGKNVGCIISPSNNESPPNQVTNGWQFYDGTNWLETNGVHFEDWTFKPSK